MKTKFTFLFLIQVAFILFSCSSDDTNDDDNGSVSLIVGTWDLSEANFPTATDFDGDGNSSVDLVEDVTCFNILTTFNDDNTYTRESVDLDIDPTGILGLRISCLDTKTQDSGSWNLSGDRLTITDADNVETVFVIALGENKYSFKQDFEEIAEVEFVFERQ